MDNSNKACVICLEAHIVGTKALHLPCGHLFHRLVVKVVVVVVVLSSSGSSGSSTRNDDVSD